MNEPIDQSTLKEVVGLSEARVREHLDHFLRKLSRNIDERFSRAFTQGRWIIVLGAVAVVVAVVAVFLLMSNPMGSLLTPIRELSEELGKCRAVLESIAETQRDMRQQLDDLQKDVSAIVTSHQKLESSQNEHWSKWMDLYQRIEHEKSGLGQLRNIIREKAPGHRGGVQALDDQEVRELLQHLLATIPD